MASRYTLFGLTGLLVLLGCVAAAQAQDKPAEAPWVEGPRQGITRTVIVPIELARDREAYGRQIALLCQGPVSCFLNFYSNSKGVELTDPLPDAIWQEPTAVYRKSTKQGAELFRWSCRLGVDPTHCF